eukprot:263060-Rhodomonas_salina.3
MSCADCDHDRTFVATYRQPFFDALKAFREPDVYHADAAWYKPPRICYTRPTRCPVLTRPALYQGADEGTDAESEPPTPPHEPIAAESESVSERAALNGHSDAGCSGRGGERPEAGHGPRVPGQSTSGLCVGED